MQNVTEYIVSGAVWPLISCIMPTFNRRPFIPLALHNFLKQDYPNRELVILDDGSDAIGDLVEGFPKVRYVRLASRMAIGAKRNLGCEQAQGDIIAQWDDDDWYAPTRLSYQAEPILTGEAEITGLENLFVMTLPHGEFWTVYPQLHERMFVCDVHGGTLVFRRSLFADGLRYPDIDLAEDAAWLSAAVARGGRLMRLPNRGVFVYARHGRNAWQFDTGRYLDPDGWQRVEPPETLPADMLACYQAAVATTNATGALNARCADSPVVWLDQLPRTRVEVPRGTLGIHGQLGHDDRMVKVQCRPYLHALSMRAPAHVTFDLGGRFNRLVCHFAINDTAPSNFRAADFAVFGDGKLITVAHAEPGEAPRRLEANISGVRELGLMTFTTAPQGCDAVWIDPFVDTGAASVEESVVQDAMNVADIHLPSDRRRAEWCVATVVPPETAGQLDRMLASVLANGGCPEALLVVFALDADDECVRVTAKHGALLIRCSSRGGSPSDVLTSILLAAPHAIDAEAFLCIDASGLVLEELRSVFASLSILPEGTLLATRRGEGRAQGTDSSIFAGRRSALVEIDAALRSVLRAGKQCRPARASSRAGQLIIRRTFNRYPHRVELDAKYNVPHDAHQLFAPVPDPLVGAADRDDYASFLTALRRWIGRYGMAGLIWSFYGLPDGETGRIRDRTMMPLFAALHSLVRANGCVRVIETGTARGVSAACLASAVAGRSGALVVTFDPYSYEGREELWSLLPSGMRACIEARVTGSIEGMAAAVETGERYEAAFLDSEHAFEHVWSEFQLATKLVCQGGLILIHDARFRGGDVPRVLERIEQAGYGVVRLWTADAGVCEDNELGLAIIENRCRTTG